MIKIEVKHIDGKDVVVAGDVTFNCYRKFIKNSDLLHSFGIVSLNCDTQPIRENYIVNGLNRKHAYNKAAGDILGCSINQFKKHLNAVLYKTFVAKYNNYFIKEFCLDRLKCRIDDDRLKQLAASYVNLMVAKQDGLDNILPYVFEYNETPQELRKRFGKGVWKKMCSFSKTRNKLICKHIRNSLKEDQAKVIGIPSSLLKHGIPLTYAQYVANSLKGLWGDKKKINEHYHTFTDCYFMFKQEGLEFNMHWSIARLKQEHDNIASKINARKYSSDKFDWTLDFQHKEFTVEEYSVKLLDNAKDIADEGTFMKHCVGSYADLSRKGEYAVFSVSKAGEKYSTIGFSLTDVNGDEVKKTFHFQQHYKKYNATVDCDVAKGIPVIICREIHKDFNLS